MEPIRLMKPAIRFEEVEADFRTVFEGGIFTRGENVDAFCSELAEYTGAKHCFLATSATTALWVCLKLLGIKAGDEVAVADFSFPATANVVEDLGATPVFIDVLPDSYNMSPDDLASKISPRTRAVIFVDALGNPTGLHHIKAICEQNGVPLIEDAACAIGSAEGGRRCGSVADLTCFSFHPRKLLNTGEGGAITTNRDDWADWLRVKLAHGTSGMNGVSLDFVDYGYNFRLPELQAIMGRKQLARLDALIDERLSIRATCIEHLEPLGFAPQMVGSDVRYNVQSLVFRVPPHIARDRLIQDLRTRAIETTIGTYCLSGTTFFSRKYNSVQRCAEELQQKTITLPCYSGIAIERVIDAIKHFLD